MVGPRQGGKKIALRGGGDTEAHFPNPPSPLLGRRDGRGGSGRGCPTVPGGGVNPTSMAQNDTHVALIILTTQMWGGEIIGGKKLFRPNFCVPVPSAPTSVLTQNKGADTEPHFSNPPPPPSAGVHVTPPPPAEQFSGRPVMSCRCVSHYALQLWGLGCCVLLMSVPTTHASLGAPSHAMRAGLSRQRERHHAPAHSRGRRWTTGGGQGAGASAAWGPPGPPPLWCGAFGPPLSFLD